MSRDYTIADVSTVVRRLAETLIAAKELLTEIDNKLGDGDMGISMANGAEALIKINITDDSLAEDIGGYLQKCAMEFNRAAPSTMGTLLSCGLRDTAKAFNGRKSIRMDEIILIPGQIAKTIAQRGKAKLGDKTILDALIPFASTVERTWNAGEDTQTVFYVAHQSCLDGMESTKGMQAKMGRARWLHDRNLDCPDGGCVMMVRLSETIKEMARHA